MAYFGEIKLLSFAKAPRNWAVCDGRLLPINDNRPLFALLGTTYGGNGRDNFALPELHRRMLLGADYELPLGATEKTAEAPASKKKIGSLALNYAIATYGSFPPSRDLGGDPIVGEIRLVAFDFAPRGWLICDGSEVPFSQHSQLGNVLGTTFGGDGQTTFKLPDLGGRVPVGSTSAIGKPGEAEIEPTEILGRDKPRALALTPIIAAEPEHGEAFIAEIRAFAFGGQYIPEGCIPCEGQKMGIASNTALFSLLGTRFGGDGKSNFELPDLRKQAVVGTNDTFRVGSKWGTQAAAKQGQPFTAITYCIASGHHGLFPPRA